MPYLKELKSQKSDILAIAAKRGCKDIRLFGSVVRGEDNEESDIDFLINMESDRSLVDLVGFKQDLEKLLHKNVDVVTEKGLHWFIRPEVLKEARPL